MIRFEDNGDIEWSHHISDRTLGGLVVTDAIYISGYIGSEGYVSKLDFQGNEQWTYVFEGNYFGNVSELTATTDGIYFRLDSMGSVNIGGVDYYHGPNTPHGFVGHMSAQGELLWHQEIDGSYIGDLRVVDGTLFVRALNGSNTHLLGFTFDGDSSYGESYSGYWNARVVASDAYGSTSVWAGQGVLNRFNLVLDDPGQIEIETMGFADPPTAVSFSAPTSQTSNYVDAALYSAFANYWAEYDESIKKRRAA